MPSHMHRLRPTGPLTFALGAAAACSLFLVAPSSAEPPRTPPRVSPHAVVQQIVGIDEVTIRYGRPAVRGRTVWGELVPLDEVWRAGANEATTIDFPTAVEVEGQPLAAGTYGLFTVPGQHRWTVIFNRVARQWGAFQYDAAQDALRVAVTPRTAPFAERLSYAFSSVTDDEVEIALRWATLEVPFRVRVVEDRGRILDRAREVMAAGPGPNLLWQWVAYLVNAEIGDPAVVTWAEQLEALRPDYYYWVSLHAQALALVGRHREAVEVGERALTAGAALVGQDGFLDQAGLDEFAAVIETWRAAAG